VSVRLTISYPPRIGWSQRKRTVEHDIYPDRAEAMRNVRDEFPGIHAEDDATFVGVLRRRHDVIVTIEEA